MRLELTRSGGLGGMTMRTAIDLDDAPEGEARELRELLERIDLDDLARRSPIRGTGADRFQYDLTVSGEGGLRHVTVAEDAAPREMRALAKRLLEREWARRRDSERGERP
jgi:hypothetical protein